tara:strand:- start:239 stop:1273 length:1035 start_codon:yes stop_codon:yes gene_type:complete
MDFLEVDGIPYQHYSRTEQQANRDYVQDPAFMERAHLNKESAPSIKNLDGSVSTHRLAAEKYNGEWYAFPTIIQGSDDSLKEYEDPFEALKENIKTNNVMRFGQDKDSAIEFAKGGYKQGTPMQSRAVDPFLQDIKPEARIGNFLKDSVVPPAAVEKVHAVDWGFIKAREGNKLSMYVPQQANAKGVKEVVGKSGNTIGMGIDLGQWSAAEFRSAGVSETLVTTLNGYFGLKNKAATDYLAKNPLTLTSDEVDEVNTAIKGQILDKLIKAFDAESLTKFVDLTAEQQTAVASVFFQYGTNKEKKKWPKNYWKQVTKGEWGKAKKNLNNFGDAFPTRRGFEADLL